jgi:phage FluMu protein Com
VKSIQAICTICGAKFDTFKGKCGSLSVKCTKCRKVDYEKQRRKENTGQTSRSKSFVAPSRESMKQAEEKQRLLDWAKNWSANGGFKSYRERHPIENSTTSESLCGDRDGSPTDEGSVYGATVAAIAVSNVPR